MVTGFSRVQIGLHWVVAALIFYNLFFGEDMKPVWDQVERGGTPLTTTGAWAHIIAGVLILTLVLWRLVLRRTRGVPDAPGGESAVMRAAGSVGHRALYALMIALPVTGLLAFYGGMTSLGGIHSALLKTLLLIVIALHLLASLYHQIVLKDGLLNRKRRPQD